MVRLIVKAAIIRTEKALSGKGQAKVQVVAAEKLGDLANVQSLSLSSSASVQNIGRQLAAVIGKKADINITDVLADTAGRIAINAANPGFLERIRNSNVNFGVLGHTLVISLDDEKNGKAYFLRDEINLRFASRVEDKALKDSADIRPVFVFRYEPNTLRPLEKVIALSRKSNNSFVVSSVGDINATIKDQADTDRFDLYFERTNNVLSFSSSRGSVAERPDGNYRAVTDRSRGKDKGKLQIFDKSSSPSTIIFTLDNINPQGFLAWLRDSNYLAVADYGKVHIIDVVARKKLLTLDAKNRIANTWLSVDWSLNDQYLGVGCASGKILIFDVKDILPGASRASRNKIPPEALLDPGVMKW